MPVCAVMKNPPKVAFTVFGQSILWSAVMIILGAAFAVAVSCIIAKRKKVTSDEVIDLALWTVPLGIVFARIYYVLCDMPRFKSFLSMLDIRQGGIALMGAILGGILGVFIYSRIRKRRFLRYADVLVPGVLLAQAIGRWGDFFNQTSYGPQITNSALKWFPLGVRIDDFGTCNYALFFYEFLWCLLLFAVVILLYKRFRHDGDAFIFYLVFYCIGRAVIEQYRVDSLMIGSVRITQILCVAVAVAGVAFISVRMIKERKSHSVIWPTPEVEEPESKYSDMEKTNAKSLEDQAACVDTTLDENDIPDFKADSDDLRKFGIDAGEDEKPEVSEDPESERDAE